MGIIQNFLVLPSNWRVRMPEHPTYHEQHGNDPDRVPWRTCMQVMSRVDMWTMELVGEAISSRIDWRSTCMWSVVPHGTRDLAPTREVVWFLRHSTVGRRNETPRDVRTDRTTIYIYIYIVVARRWLDVCSEFWSWIVHYSGPAELAWRGFLFDHGPFMAHWARSGPLRTYSSAMWDGHCYDRQDSFW